MNTRNIILDAMHELYMALADILYGAEQEWATLDDLVAAIMKALTIFAGRLIEQYVGEVHELFFRTGKRLRPNLLVKERHLHKSVVTEIGQLILPKDVYIDRETGQQTAPVLQKLEIKPHQKVTDEVIGRCVEAALELSYGKASQVITGGGLTRQTVSNTETKEFMPQQTGAYLFVWLTSFFFYSWSKRGANGRAKFSVPWVQASLFVGILYTTAVCRAKLQASGLAIWI